MASTEAYSLWMALVLELPAVIFGSCCFWRLILSTTDLLESGVSLSGDTSGVVYFPDVKSGSDYYLDYYIQCKYHIVLIFTLVRLFHLMLLDAVAATFGSYRSDLFSLVPRCA